LWPRACLPLAPPGQFGHVRTPLIQGKVEAGTQPIPPLLDGHDVRVAAADLARDGARGKCFLQARAVL
jgi:hypothetical protein